MSAAAAAVENPEDAPAPKAGKKKLILIIIVAVVVLAIVGGGVAFWMKKRAAHAAELAAAEEEGGAKVEKKIDLSHPPTFLPLEPFVVNLADRDSDRYAQIGITLELESPAFAEQVKVFMPAVRNAILMVIAHKSAKDLLGRAGKEDLADEIMREALKPMGIEVETPVRIREPSAAAKAEATLPAAMVVPTVAATGEHGAASGAEPAAAAASEPMAAAATASAAASAVVRVAAATAAHGEKADKAEKGDKADKGHGHGDGASPIHHVHFSSFIIQ